MLGQLFYEATRLFCERDICLMVLRRECYEICYGYPLPSYIYLFLCFACRCLCVQVFDWLCKTWTYCCIDRSTYARAEHTLVRPTVSLARLVLSLPHLVPYASLVSSCPHPGSGSVGRRKQKQASYLQPVRTAEFIRSRFSSSFRYSNFVLYVHTHKIRQHTRTLPRQTLS